MHYDEQAEAFNSISKGLEEAIYLAEVVGTKCDRNLGGRREHVSVEEEYPKTPLKQPINNPVSSPNHYLKLGYECIELIASSLSKEAFRGYCMGNFLKYRFRMGDKDELMQDFDKSKEYLMLYDKYNHLCQDSPF